MIPRVACERQVLGPLIPHRGSVRFSLPFPPPKREEKKKEKRNERKKSFPSFFLAVKICCRTESVHEIAGFCGSRRGPSSHPVRSPDRRSLVLARARARARCGNFYRRFCATCRSSFRSFIPLSFSPSSSFPYTYTSATRANLLIVLHIRTYTCTRNLVTARRTVYSVSMHMCVHTYVYTYGRKRLSQRPRASCGAWASAR